jgi:hypothetical protein
MDRSKTLEPNKKIGNNEKQPSYRKREEAALGTQL